MNHGVKAPQLSRRRFLRLLGVAGLGAAASAVFRIPAVEGLGQLRRPRYLLWSNPDTWGGKVPGRDDLVVVSKRIVLDRNARVGGIVVKPKGELIFHPRRNITLSSKGNITVRGRLTMRPRRPSIVQRLQFHRIDESRFVGGSMNVLPTDVGLWVTDGGVIDVSGSPKLAWTRATAAVPSGTTSMTLQHDPVGWRVGDEVAITPTLPPSNPIHDVAYDMSIVASIDRLSRRITLTSPTKFEHPAVEVEPGVVLTAEVLNLSRNVQIEGSPAGRSHIWMRSSRRQTIRNASIRYTGPRRPGTDPNLPGSTVPVPGRYGLHFHMMENASRGSIVTGVVVRDSGSHAFVAHMSHGVTFRDCISHNTFEEAYWWDPSPDENKTPAHPTDDVLYERCVASAVRSDPSYWGFRLAGFFLGARNRNVARNCVAVGVQGNVDSSGFTWPQFSGGLWTFEDCVAHNNRMNGIFAWQTNDAPHVVSRFVAYHNGRAGIKHGSYRNGFLYEDSVLYANGSAAVDLDALSIISPVLSFSGLRCDQAGASAYCVVTAPHLAAPGGTAQFAGCRFRGYSKAAFGFVDEASPFPNLYSIVDCSFTGNEFWLGAGIHPASLIRFQDPAKGTLTLRRADQLPGVFRPEWNASVST